MVKVSIRLPGPFFTTNRWSGTAYLPVRGPGDRPKDATFRANCAQRNGPKKPRGPTEKPQWGVLCHNIITQLYYDLGRFQMKL